MIVRIFQATTHPGKEAAFAEFFHNTAIPMMRKTPGIVALLPCAPRPDHPRNFGFVMVWESLDALKAFVGEDYDAPHIDPDEAELVQWRSIHHYTLVEDGATYPSAHQS